jgi:hypothetical protein
MSTRPAVLCDKVSGTSSADKCGNMASGTCPLCDDDVCSQHAMHPKGGLIVTMELRGLEPNTEPPMNKVWGQSLSALNICAPCGRRALSHLGTVHDLAETAAMTIRAALAASALEQEGKKRR